MTPDQRDLLSEILATVDFDDIEPELKDGIVQATLAGASNAMVGGETDDSMVSEINQNAHDYAKERAAELVGTGEQSISETTRDTLRDLITNSFEENTSLDDLLDGILNSGVFSQGRALMIARTEVNRAENGGNINAYREMGNVDLVDWVNGEEACDICQGYEEDGPYTLKEAEDLLDETHPMCRCGIIPHLEDDED